MARGGFPGMGGKNMNGMMKQIQKLQKDMETMQANLDSQEFEASSGGGVVKATVNGKKEIVSIQIDPEVVDPEDVETLEDLLIAALREAMNIAEEKTQNEMAKLTGGMNLPGMF
ncbi:YbaB/EbfC family nucleoid-associated protein [Peptoniphilus sp. KCTC 25270]|uniref:YbaB/EbfC family nucleoid-associated protein n=1 Tax=Peptoniphilus sp. KCTC 25270 TaxID=2897414 RepID=UPI001E30FDB9|nr:YbaB/EbfC family nucleoid-associated protein [Peptoniphilus sp. KCTC 25270]MCD1146882.1 YbaB/EbfC family nucleoid-associated protein [Peptoniphilus sp. KCTC 25270]